MAFVKEMQHMHIWDSPQMETLLALGTEMQHMHIWGPPPWENYLHF